MLYCSMVEECAKLNVKKSMDEIEWTSDQFKLVLAKHHEQIGVRLCLGEIFIEIWKLLSDNSKTQH